MLANRELFLPPERQLATKKPSWQDRVIQGFRSYDGLQNSLFMKFDTGGVVLLQVQQSPCATLDDSQVIFLIAMFFI